LGRAFGFVTLIIVVAAGAYIYMRQTRSAMTAGTSSPTATVDLIGVRNDLLAIAQAERSHAALSGGYASIETLRSQGELSMLRDNRGPYNYSAEIDGSSFRIVATWTGSESAGMPKTISIDQTMTISQE
jgi:predicted aspartyl protease